MIAGTARLPSAESAVKVKRIARRIKPIKRLIAVDRKYVIRDLLVSFCFAVIFD